VNKILITGFKHSGTTMLMGLLRMHPDVGWIEMEEGYIEYDKPKKWVLQMASKKVPNLKKKIWGEKIPWGNREEDKRCDRAIGFTKRWLKMFKSEARVLHIIRHPIDVASSGRPDGNPGEKTLKNILKTVPEYIEKTNKYQNVATVIYENLVINPQEHLKNILYFCGMRDDQKTLTYMISGNLLKYGKLNADRAFAFKKKGVISDIDYDGIINLANTRL
jgi:hypothetical protein